MAWVAVAEGVPLAVGAALGAAVAANDAGLIDASEYESFAKVMHAIQSALDSVLGKERPDAG